MPQELKTKSMPKIGCVWTYFGVRLDILWSTLDILWMTLDDLGVPPTNGRCTRVMKSDTIIIVLDGNNGYNFWDFDSWKLFEVKNGKERKSGIGIQRRAGYERYPAVAKRNLRL